MDTISKGGVLPRLQCDALRGGSLSVVCAGRTRQITAHVGIDATPRSACFLVGTGLSGKDLEHNSSEVHRCRGRCLKIRKILICVCYIVDTQYIILDKEMFYV